MKRMGHRARGASHLVRALTVSAVAVACGALLFSPGKVGAVAATDRLILPVSQDSPATSSSGQAFDGTAATGALFTESDGKLGTHFCTASVVQSTHGDLAVTAAHCVTGLQGQMVFVPGYSAGKEPHGAWPVTAVYTNQAWQSSRNPDDDFAFLRLAASGGAPIQDVTGGERLGISWHVPALVRVIGYPDGADQPIACTNWAEKFSPTQLVFDCGGYTDGTSGGPFLADVSAASGEGTVIGVIGGYEQGGDLPQVSYAAAFGAGTEALFHTAEAGG
jgi:V8-like Glu-specific endopeptidase